MLPETSWRGACLPLRTQPPLPEGPTVRRLDAAIVSPIDHDGGLPQPSTCAKLSRLDATMGDVSAPLDSIDRSLRAPDLTRAFAPFEPQCHGGVSSASFPSKHNA